MRIGVLGIIIDKDRSVASEVQALLSTFGEIIIGRLGVPDRESGIHVISVIVKGSNEQISALSGKLGKLKNVKVKSSVIDVLGE